MHSAAEEVKARGAYVIAITNLKLSNKSVYDEIITIPDCGVMTSLLTVLPMQYMSYKLSLALNYNPDYPRNLSKTVVVD
jgi:glucosamine--fructose-6-phosphate aminotransferase (isomerizing)